jgi:hypothetical protein
LNPPPNPASIFLKSRDILGRTPYRALYHPRDNDVIDCGITSENAGDQFPNHLLRVLNVSSTFIELAFVNVRINNLPFRIYLHLGDFLDLGFDNRFQVIDPMDEEDEGDDNKDEANDSERDLEGEVADELKEEEHGNNSCLSPNRPDEKEEEKEEQQSPPPKPPTTMWIPMLLMPPKLLQMMTVPMPPKPPPVHGKKDPHKMMRLFHEGNPAGFRRIAPVKVPRFAKRPAKRQAEEINSDQKAKKARKLFQDRAADKGRTSLVYLEADGNGKVFIPLTAGTLLSRTPVPSQPGHIDIGIGDVLSGEGIPKGLVKVDTVHPITRIEV